MAKKRFQTLPIQCIVLAALLTWGTDGAGAAETPKKAGRVLSVRSRKTKELQTQSSAKTDPGVWSMQGAEDCPDPYVDPYAYLPPQPVGYGYADGVDVYQPPGVPPPSEPYVNPELDRQAAAYVEASELRAYNRKPAPAVSGTKEKFNDKGLRLRRRRVPDQSCSPSEPPAPVCADPAPGYVYESPVYPAYQTYPTYPAYSGYTAPVYAPPPAPVAQPLSIQADSKADEETGIYDKYHNVITDNPLDQDEKSDKKHESESENPESQPSPENDALPKQTLRPPNGATGDEETTQQRGEPPARKEPEERPEERKKPEQRREEEPEKHTKPDPDPQDLLTRDPAPAARPASHKRGGESALVGRPVTIVQPVAANPEMTRPEEQDLSRESSVASGVAFGAGVKMPETPPEPAMAARHVEPQAVQPPPPPQRRPAPPPQPTREEVEDYRQRLELRLLERYNNLPDHAGNVGRVEVVLSRPLDVSLDGSRIKAEFDQLVYDPWGRRIPALEDEYFVVTFAAGGARQVRTDPSIRVGLNHEASFSERMPLNADPFSKVQGSKAFAPTPKPAENAKKMAAWWRPDFPELQ